jgi:hypothetical protein
MDECDSWSKRRDALEVLVPEMDSFAVQPTDIISENMHFNDAPLEQDDTPHIPTLYDPHCSHLKSIKRRPNQDPARRLYRGYSLSLSEIRTLRAIAMPHYAFSIETRSEEEESSRSSETETEAQGKKRKSSTSSEENEAVHLPQKRKQLAHNAIEKRYRSNLNDKIYALRQRVPSLRTIPEGVQADDNAGEGESSAPKAGHKRGKAEVLTGAIAYISHLEGAVERLGGEVVVLKARVMAFKKLALSGSIVLSSDPSSRALVMETLQTVRAGKLKLQEFNL